MPVATGGGGSPAEAGARLPSVLEGMEPPELEAVPKQTMPKAPGQWRAAWMLVGEEKQGA